MIVLGDRMRTFDYKKQSEKLFNNEIISLLTQINELKGQLNQYVDVKEDTLEQLVEIAKIQSTEASNKIEGIYTSDERLKKLVLSKTMPKSRNEEEIAGYRDVLSTIHENYEYIPVKPAIILQLHRDLYKFSSLSIGGSFKAVDNFIQETDEKGNKFVRFTPVEAWETPNAIEQICDEYNEVIGNKTADHLLTTVMFILDFLCIHPFSDGNGRMSRLLTLLLLYRTGFMVGKYISIENLIEKTKDSYYSALQQSSDNWHEGTNDYMPFVKYMLGVIIAAYRDLSDRIKLLGNKDISKPDMIENYIQNTLGKVTKAEIMKEFPDISQVTVQRALADLLSQNKIIKIGGGRYTSYTWNREKE